MLNPFALPTRKFAKLQLPSTLYEPLEARTMLSVALNAAGWTVITPGAGDRIIYCSSSTGNDNNTGLSPTLPVKTFPRAESLMQNHTGDELLLKAGDVWHSDFIFWTRSGKSAQDPMVIGSYGTGARPEVMSGDEGGFATGSVASPEVDYLAIMGIHFLADTRDPNLTTVTTKKNPVGINFLTKSNDILVENCELEYYDVDLNFQDYLGPLQNVSVRRNIILDAWSTNAHAQGMYATGVSNLDIEGNFFDHDGWNAQIAGAVPTFFNHDCYLSGTNSGCVIKDNVFAEAAAFGLQDRPGGIVENNVFFDDPTGMSFGLVNGATSTAGGVTGIVSGNVFLGGGNIGKSPAGGGMVVGNIRPGAGAVISNNVFSQGEAGASAAIMLDFGYAQPNESLSVGINNLKIENNVFYNWTVAINAEGGMATGGTGPNAFNSVSILNNQFENISGATLENHDPSYSTQETVTGNEFYNTGNFLQQSKWVPVIGTVTKSVMPFLNPNRTVASYDGSLGEIGTVADFLSVGIHMSEANWDTRFEAASVATYVINGFALPTGPARSARSTFQALAFDSQLGGLKFDNYNGLGYISGGDWAEYNQIDFGTGVTKFTAMIAALPGQAGSIQLRLDSPTGTLIGTLKTTSTGAWSTYTAQLTGVTGAKGVHNLYLVFVGGQYSDNVESFHFS